MRCYFLALKGVIWGLAVYAHLKEDLPVVFIICIIHVAPCQAIKHPKTLTIFYDRFFVINA